MKLGMSLVLVLAAASLQVSWLARAEPRHEERGGERHEEKRENRREEHLPPRSAPPEWRGHPPGAHPNGAPFHAHAIRVLRPHVARYGEHPWHHWGHAEFVRPAYYWNWGAIRRVTCIAEDSYGDQYPVTESTFAGFGLVHMTAVEDDALDRCFDESGGDPSCYLATCSHF